MSDNPFANPASAAGIQWSDLKGRLLVVEPITVERGIQTAFGETDAVRANVYAIDATPEEFPDTLVFPKGLQSQLRPKLGEKVIGRLGQGNAKPSQSPPWLIQDATDADIELGKQWLAARSKAAFTGPAQAAQAGGGEPPF